MKPIELIKRQEINARLNDLVENFDCYCITYLESLWVSLRSGRDCALAKKAPRVMISIKFLFFSDSQVNFTRACQFWSQLINQKK
jgi:hypothetical protein